MKKVLITQSNYVPWKGYFDAIASVDEFILFDCAQYTRQDWRNRNLIKTAKGTRWLTVPVTIDGLYTQKIRETRIADREWRRQHWNLLESAYREAPSFREMSPLIRELYDGAFSGLLSEVNHFLITGICTMLGIKTRITHSSEYELIDGKSERLVHMCRQAGATDYYAGPSARAYMNERLFEEAGIRVHYLDYSGYPTYRQSHGEFVHQVSILDLLFNEGENSSRYMKLGSEKAIRG